MTGDNLNRAREHAEQAVRSQARYPSSENATKARLALRTLQKIASNVGAQRIYMERTHLADRIWRITRS